MPYIRPSSRETLDQGKDIPRSVGELNYVITKLLLRYMKSQYDPTGYASYNDVIGVLECVKMELYRRAIAPYEDQMIEKNGDVFTSNEDA